MGIRDIMIIDEKTNTARHLGDDEPPGRGADEG
jgi:hypothetical protein